MTRQQFEDTFSLTLITDFGQHGVTERSKSDFLQHRMHPGDVKRVYLVYDPEDWSQTYIVDALDRALCFSGFGWGFGGEGPHGLLWMFEQLGWDVDYSALPSAHEEGVWLVTAEGGVTRLE